MNFDKTTVADCIIPPVQPPDGRCSDADYALAHPGTCASALILKPSLINVCLMGSVQFKVYEFRNGTETLVTSGLAFESSNLDVFPVGVNSGSGTGLEAGDAIITVTNADGKTASAKVTVFPTVNCCDEIEVTSLVVLDVSRSSSLPFGAGYSTRLDFAKAAAKLFSTPVRVGNDQAKILTLDVEVVDVTEGFSTDDDQIQAAIDSIQQGYLKTDLLLLFSEIAI